MRKEIRITTQYETSESSNGTKYYTDLVSPDRNVRYADEGSLFVLREKERRVKESKELAVSQKIIARKGGKKGHGN